MSDDLRTQRDKATRDDFDASWKDGEDPWDCLRSPYEKARHARLFEILCTKHYGHVLEIGCGRGVLTHQLAQIADKVIGVDVSPAAIEKARTGHPTPANTEFVEMNILDYDVSACAPWDLVVFSEVLYYMGDRYTVTDIFYLLERLYESMAQGGTMLMCSIHSLPNNILTHPPLMEIYKHMIACAGFRLTHEELFYADDNGVECGAQIWLFTKE